MPDLDQIKQGEQVTTSALEGTGLAPRRDSERGDHRHGRSPRISDLAITALAVIWLQKQPGAAEGDLFAKGQSGNAVGPNRRFHEPGHMGCRAVALPNSVRLMGREAREKTWVARPPEKASAKFDHLIMRGIIDSVQVTFG